MANESQDTLEVAPEPACAAESVDAVDTGAPDIAPLVMLFERNSAYVPLYQAALEACAQGERPLQEVAAAIDAARSAAYQIQSATALIEALERKGGLARQLLVDGKPYAGTMRDLQQDDAVSPEARVDQVVCVTPAGRAFLESRANPGSALEAAIARTPHLELGLRATLDLCAGEGKTTAQLQQDLRALGALPADARGIETVHASFYTGALETAGALVWREGRWHAAE